jgi:hypothetical protein
VLFAIILLQFRDVIYERWCCGWLRFYGMPRLVINSVSQELYLDRAADDRAGDRLWHLVGLYLRAEALEPEKRPLEDRPVSRARHWTELIYVRAPIQYTRELMNNEVRRLLLTHFGFEGEVDRDTIEK